MMLFANSKYPVDGKFAIGEYWPMKLVIERGPTRRLMDLPPKARTALLERLKAIAADPFAQHANITAFKGERDAFRLRQGDWRVVYRLDREADEMRVGAIEPRG